MSLIQRIAREPNAVAGVIAAAYGLLVAFEVLALTVQQVGACVAFWGALVILLRWLVAPAAEVMVQRRPQDPTPIAGAAALEPTGAPVLVDLTPLPKDQAA
ncbi:hypothetical protein [Nocardioides sp. SYSU D00065]|uniref:hypothetical protein n=1 Tax=Nocardioides sp. SYSU D00065 TaxID=2817378 RepID=UPI001B32261A|nr:hypothetical protein [Nocardioides sp. SYSU D00065]